MPFPSVKRQYMPDRPIRQARQPPLVIRPAQLPPTEESATASSALVTRRSQSPLAVLSPQSSIDNHHSSFPLRPLRFNFLLNADRWRLTAEG